MTEASSVNLDSTPKQIVLGVVRHLPDEVTLEEIRYTIFLFQRAMLVRQAIANGDVLSHEEVKERMKQWLLPET
jgi:hypothetical protein